jgi:UDP-3-O-acyl-N-acetylglucosamine deacetylase
MKEIEVLNIEKKTLQAECAQNLASCNNFRNTWIECKKIEILQMKGSDDEWVSALKAKGFPSVQKETNGPALTEMVSKALFAIMAVTMAYT